MNPIVLAIVVLVVRVWPAASFWCLLPNSWLLYEDPRIAQITECLAVPTARAAAMPAVPTTPRPSSWTRAPTFKCAPGGDKAADAINTIMGNDTDDSPQPACYGHLRWRAKTAASALTIMGIQTCAAAAALAGGPSACAYGCLGLGDCTRACKIRCHPCHQWCGGSRP